MKNSSLLVFTIDFPYGKGESFLFNEIKILSNKFQMIYIFPMNYSDNQFEYELPENVQVVKFNMFQPFNRLKVLFKNSALISSIYFFELIQSSSRLKYLSQFFQTLNNLTHKISAANNFSIICKQMKIDNPIAYTYWFNQWTLLLSIVKVKHQNLALYTRIHGMDVYEEQHPQKTFFFQFRAFQLKQIKKVFAISINGKNHLQKHNQLSTNKIVLARLGTMDCGLCKQEKLSHYRIVSCSAFQSYKRVDLIIDVLSKINQPIEWIHFGNGELQHEILSKAKTLPTHITFNWQGFKANSIIMDYYKNNAIDLFINVSSTEGIPVSIMEAISFGIPVIATNVGGVAEIVNDQTGFLIEKDFNINNVSKTIESYLTSSIEFKTTLKHSARKFWEENYNAEKNYNLLSLELN